MCKLLGMYVVQRIYGYDDMSLPLVGLEHTCLFHYSASLDKVMHKDIKSFLQFQHKNLQGLQGHHNIGRCIIKKIPCHLFVVVISKMKVCWAYRSGLLFGTIIIDNGVVICLRNVYCYVIILSFI